MLKRCFIILLVLLLLPACTPSITTEPTPLQSPTPSPSPTRTPLPPTSTATATLTSTPTATASLNTLVVAEGFSISIPYLLRYQVNESSVLIGDEQNVLSISFTGEVYDGAPLMRVVDSYLGSLEKRGWQFTKGDPVDIQIDGAAGLLVDLTGTAGDISFEGQAVAASPRSDFVLFGLGISKTNADNDSWRNEGKATFEGLLQAIRFADLNATCPISTDKTYGYTEANPIKVGGDAFNGPSRERAYLGHLRGPNGEELSFEREGSFPSGDTILDVYRVTGPGIEAVLYLDEYNFSELQAPVGFTCNGAFPLSAP